MTQFFNFFTIIVIIHTIFLVLFPNTGLGAVIYLPISFIGWSFLGFILALIKKKTGEKNWIEILFCLVLVLFLLFNFVQDGDSPILQIQNGDWNLLNSVEIGLKRWDILIVICLIYILAHVIFRSKKNRKF